MGRRKQQDPGARFTEAKWLEGLPRPQVAPPQRMSWAIRTEGACAKLPASALAGDPFAVDDSVEDPHGAAFAKSVCQGCPLRQRCLDYAMEHEPYGIYGGFDAVERLARRGRPIPSYEERVEAAKVRAMFATGLTAEEVAQRYGVVRRTVERWRAAAGLAVPREAAA